jgi:hypothetical protein
MNVRIFLTFAAASATATASDAKVFPRARRFLGGPDVFCRGVFDVGVLGRDGVADAVESIDTDRTTGRRWLDRVVCIRPHRGRNLKSRYLRFAQRQEITVRRIRGQSLRYLGAAIGRPASRISRELSRPCGGVQVSGIGRARVGISASIETEASEAAPEPAWARGQRSHRPRPIRAHPLAAS